MKKIACALLVLMMIVSLLPMAAFAEEAAVLESHDLPIFKAGDKADGEAQEVNGFTIYWSAKSKIDGSNKTWSDGYAPTTEGEEKCSRMNFGGKTQFKEDGTIMNAVKFTVDAAATVKVWWVQGGEEGESRQVALYSEAGEILSQTEDSSPKNDPVISEFEVPEAGTYFLGNPDGNNYFFKVEVTPKAGEPDAPALTTPEEIVDAAWALEKDTALEGEFELTGVVTEIGSPYSEQYKNITVTIVVAGKEDKPIVCYRLKGEGADQIVVGDTLTVKGTLKNYNGTVEFDSGCALLKREATGTPDTFDPSSMTMAELVDAAYALEDGKSLSKEITLTGAVTEIGSAYSEEYKNVTVTIVIEGKEDKPIVCFRMKGDEAANVAVGDVITVTGVMKNYKGTIEFDAGCRLTARQEQTPVTPDPNPGTGDVAPIFALTAAISLAALVLLKKKN